MQQFNCLNEFDSYIPNYTSVSEDSVLKAEKLSNYFIAMGKKIKLTSYETKDIKKSLNKNEDKTNYQKVLSVYKNNKDFNRSKMGELLGVSRRTIQRYVAEIENNVKILDNSGKTSMILGLEKKIIP